MTSRSSRHSDSIWDTESDSAALHRYRELTTVVDVGIFELNPSGYFVGVNDTLLELAGSDREALLGEHLSVLLGEQDADLIQREILALDGTADTVPTFDVTVQTADGATVPCELRISRVRENDEIQGTVGTVRETTASGRTSIPKTPDNVLSTALQKVDSGTFVLDSDFEIVWAGETVGEYFGVDPCELVGRDKREIVQEVIKDRVAEPEQFADRVLSAYDTNNSIEQFTCEVTAGDDRQHRWLEHWSKPIESGRFSGGRIELYDDVTDQKLTAAALEETEERFQSLVDAVEEYAIFRLDRNGNVISWNEGAKKIKGYEADEILGQHISNFYTETERAAGLPEQNLAAATEHQSIEDEGWRLRKDGSRFWANVTISTVRDDDGSHQGYLKVTRDMTDRHEREQELESELHRILSRISDAFYAVDEEWRFTLVNEQAEELLQRPREELLGESLWEMFPEASETIVWDRFHEAMESQEPVNFDIKYDALGIWAEASAYPSESGLSVYFRDITERRKKQREIREREQQLTEYKQYTNRILNTVDDLLYVVAEDGSFERWNESLSNVTGYSDEEIASMKPVDFFGEKDQELIANAVEEVFETGDTRVEADILTKDGQEIPIEFVASAVETPNGETVLAGIGRDITERIERKEALEESNERLEQFAHAASHDLQEPLRMVSSYLQLLDRRYGTQLDEEGREFLEFAVHGADRMRDMIDGLLEYSRIESKGSPLEPVDLDTVHEDACDNLRVAIEEHDAEITSDPLPVVDGDGRQLRQLFQNLLDNAIKYSGDEPPRVHVSAERVVSGDSTGRTEGTATGDQWIISVRDEGIAIPSDDQERIFEVFQSLDRPTNNGSGLGLALCKRIVERHGGDIWVDSSGESGTTISFTLPAVGDRDD
jgi:PAS domain S-box-containing protein